MPTPYLANGQPFLAIASDENTSSDQYVVIGAFAFDASEYRVVRFATVAAVSDEGIKGQIQLYNLTDMSEVIVHEYEDVTTPVLIENDVTLPAGLKVYEARHRVLDGDPSADRIITSWAGFVITV
jgi:hypothetical protein